MHKRNNTGLNKKHSTFDEARILSKYKKDAIALVATISEYMEKDEQKDIEDFIDTVWRTAKSYGRNSYIIFIHDAQKNTKALKE